MVGEYPETLGDHVGREAFDVDQFVGGARRDPFVRNESTQCEGVRLDLLPRALADAVKARSRSGFRCVKKKMAELVIEHCEFPDRRQLAVDGDEITVLHAIVKSANRKRHLLDHDPEPPAQPIKIDLGQRAIVPAKIELRYLFDQKLHESVST